MESDMKDSKGVNYKDIIFGKTIDIYGSEDFGLPKLLKENKNKRTFWIL